MSLNKITKDKTGVNANGGETGVNANGGETGVNANRGNGKHMYRFVLWWFGWEMS